jgi:hypothetical protein
MMTKQNDAVALTDEQLDAVAAGSVDMFIKIDGVQDGMLRMDKGRRSGLLSGRTPALRTAEQN